MKTYTSHLFCKDAVSDAPSIKIIPPDTVLYETLTPAREAPLYVMRSFLSEHIFIQGMFFQCLRDFDHIGQISDHDNACKAVV